RVLDETAAETDGDAARQRPDARRRAQNPRDVDVDAAVEPMVLVVEPDHPLERLPRRGKPDLLRPLHEALAADGGPDGRDAAVRVEPVQLVVLDARADGSQREIIGDSPVRAYRDHVRIEHARLLLGELAHAIQAARHRAAARNVIDGTLERRERNASGRTGARL